MKVFVVLSLAMVASAGAHTDIVMENSQAGRPAVAGIVAPSTPLDGRVAQIFQANCVRCHSPGGDAADQFGSILDTDGLIKAKVIVPGNPDRSDLIQAVEGGDMPQDADSLSAADIKTLRDWVTALGKPATP
jgi:mono/diheme cytochrome c family protein